MLKTAMKLCGYINHVSKLFDRNGLVEECGEKFQEPTPTPTRAEVNNIT
jgi:hypothetical protein